MREGLQVIRLIEPHLCINCRFGRIVQVHNEDGEASSMIRCRRLDCDNWDYSSLPELESIYVEMSEEDK